MTEEEGKEMLKNIYVYVVLFATLMMSIGGSIGIFTGVAEYLAPDIYMMPYESFREMRLAYPENNEILNEAVIRAEYETEKQEKIEGGRRYALRQIITSLGWIIIPLPIFLYYNKQGMVTSVGRANFSGRADRE